MRHKGLLITVIILLIIFVSTLTAGVILAGTTVGWAEIGDSIRNGTFGDGFFDRFDNFGNRIGFRDIGYSIDETRTDNLQGVSAIVVRVVSERVNVREGDSQFTARLSGNYVGLSRLQWEVERQGSTLVVNTRHPWSGMRMANLVMDLQIPKTFNGDVEIRTVSGTCDIVSSPDSAWKSLKYDAVSGALQAGTAIWPRVDAKSVSGAIRLNDVRGRLSAETVSGGLDIGYGSDSVPESNLETVSGRILVNAPQSAKFSLLFTTVSGGFDTSRLQMQVTSQANRRTEAMLNGGGNRITAKTVSGSLIMQPRDASTIPGSTSGTNPGTTAATTATTAATTAATSR